MDVTNSKSISVDTNRARFFNSQLFSVFRLTMTSGVQRDAGALSQCANIIRSSGLFKNNLTKTRQTDKESLFFCSQRISSSKWRRCSPWNSLITPPTPKLQVWNKVGLCATKLMEGSVSPQIQSLAQTLRGGQTCRCVQVWFQWRALSFQNKIEICGGMQTAGPVWNRLQCCIGVHSEEM